MRGGEIGGGSWHRGSSTPSAGRCYGGLPHHRGGAWLTPSGAAATVVGPIPRWLDHPWRLPLLDRHRSAGARLHPVRRLGDAGAVRGHPRRARRRAHARPACSTSRTWARSRRAGRRRCGAPAAHCCPTTSRRIAVGGAQYCVMCREDGGVLDDLFTYRLGERPLPHGHERRQPRARPRLARRATPTGFDVEVPDRRDDYAMLAVQGPQAREIVQALADGRAAGAVPHGAARRRGRGRARLRHRLHRRGRRRAALAADDAERVWDAVVAAGVTPAGLAARDTLRLEACFHLYGNDLMEERGPIEAGLGWCCKEATGFIGAEASARRAAGRRELVPFVPPAASPAGQPDRGGGVVTSGTLSPCSASASAWPTSGRRPCG